MPNQSKPQSPHPYKQDNVRTNPLSVQKLSEMTQAAKHAVLLLRNYSENDGSFWESALWKDEGLCSSNDARGCPSLLQHDGLEGAGGPGFELLFLAVADRWPPTGLYQRLAFIHITNQKVSGCFRECALLTKRLTILSFYLFTLYLFVETISAVASLYGTGWDL